MTQREMEEQIRQERLQYESLLKWAKTLAREEHPSLMQEKRKFIMRFYKNQRGYWLPASLTEKSVDQIDIYEYEDDGYLYYIREKGFDVLIFARELFLDFNKPTDKYGNICRLDDVNGRILANLNGYCWDINNIDPDAIYKCEYFQNRHGTRYTSQVKGFYNMLISLTNLNKGSKLVPEKLQSTKEGIIWCNLIDATKEKALLEISEKILADRLMKDVRNTNPDDLENIAATFKM